jgi:hypothetical protein
MGSSWRSSLLAFFLTVLTVDSADPSYRSVSVDSAGRLHIELDSGVVIQPPMLQGQVSFGDPAISPDHQTVGWLVMYPYPSAPGAKYVPEPIAGSLVLYRSRRISHRFRTEQTFWDWQFQDGGRQVAYSTGPTHGGAAQCVLREVDSGKVVASWWVRGAEEPPAWARTLRF